MRRILLVGGSTLLTVLLVVVMTLIADSALRQKDLAIRQRGASAADHPSSIFPVDEVAISTPAAATPAETTQATVRKVSAAGRAATVYSGQLGGIIAMSWSADGKTLALS